MKVLFTILSDFIDIKNKEVIPEFTFNDVMDGSPDTMSLSFIHDEDIINKIKLKTKAKVEIYDGDELFKTYNLCISDIACEKNSMAIDNGYTYTVKLKEHTVYLKDCIRTDLTISPSLYPENTYPTLKEALFKVIDCHNIPLFNEKILSVDENILNKLENIACNNITYKDLSTFEQLSDLFDRIGYIPYFEDGVLSGFSKQGEIDITKELANIVDISSYSSIKSDIKNYDVLATKTYNTIFDDEFIVVPNIFASATDVYLYEELTSVDIPYKQYNHSGYWTYEPDPDKIGEYFNKRYKHWTTGDNEAFNGQIINETVSRPLFISNFDTKANSANDAREYYLELPSNIENIEAVYLCKPRIFVYNNANSGENGESNCNFGWGLEKQNMNRLVEKSFYDNLSALHQRRSAYYKRGDNKIYNIISMIADNNSLGISGNSLVDGSLVFGEPVLFDILKKSYFVVVYKPLTTQQYSTYDYSKAIGNEKPLSIQNINMPYKQVSDKQVSNILSFELQKKSDTTYNAKFMTQNLDILNFKASDIIKLLGKPLIITSMELNVANNLIECSFELNENIISNSMISNYTDTIRVSTNLSTENVVVRDLPIYRENILILNDEIVNKSQISNYESKTYELAMSRIGLNNLGFLTSFALGNPIYDLASEYVGLNALGNSLGEWSNKIKILGGHYHDQPYGNRNEIPVNFPLYARQLLSNEIADDYSGVISWRVSPFSYEVKINDMQQLIHFLNRSEVGMYHAYKKEKEDIIPVPVIVNYSFYNTQGQPFGSDAVIRHLGHTHNYDYRYNKAVFMAVGGETADTYSATNFEKIVSTSGNITSINFKFNSPCYVNCKFPENSINFVNLVSGMVLDGMNTLEVDDANIERSLPYFYNTKEYGCKVKKVANIDLDDEFDLYSNLKYGLILDLREIINPYIQYTTIRARDGFNCEIKEINPNLNWLDTKSNNGEYTYSLYNLVLYKVKKGLCLNTLDLGYSLNENDEFVVNTPVYAYLVNDITTYSQPISKLTCYEDLTLQNTKTLEKDDDFDYIVVREHKTEQFNKVPLFRFSNKKDTDTLYLHSYIVSSN